MVIVITIVGEVIWSSAIKVIIKAYALGEILEEKGKIIIIVSFLIFNWIIPSEGSCFKAFEINMAFMGIAKELSFHQQDFIVAEGISFIKSSLGL